MSDAREVLAELEDLERFARNIAPEMTTAEGRRVLGELRSEVVELRQSVTNGQRSALAGAAHLAEVGARHTEGIPGSFVQAHMKRARASSIFGASLLSPRKPAREAPPAPVLPEEGIGRIAQNIADGLRVELGARSLGIDEFMGAWHRRGGLRK